MDDGCLYGVCFVFCVQQVISRHFKMYQLNRVQQKKERKKYANSRENVSDFMSM